ncbi:methylenetetrahydrofolate reductase [Dictyostelium purpureum]|uniref:methylenetetrahydrofolate reductase (NADH) n=1 Tax=Dictyostelium purpureum TaxID=5786 RepID=F0ZME6_DICPU|nr:methylenetetrahydrofolate reductase [Dictyostelium purpureum]EGC34903.1 methylenetetrahydrofolate reductase [Dictyostelium purpureum]|eukprot:XP_003288595.1 methylenetetrahydrofolate reductase [Dictyostelium purpureum]
MTSMKIIDKINQKKESNVPFYSFEYFPPKTMEGVQNLYDRLGRMLLFEPLFIDITWGAGGSTSALTLEIAEKAQNVCGLETMMHLTCTNMPVNEIIYALDKAKATGIRNILALRGDPPRGEEWKKIEGGFGYACDLVKFIRERYGDYFGICVAGYPEGHSDCTSFEDDITHLKAKVDAGADLIITQLFYDVDVFCDFVKKCREVGINCPIIPGIMPIQTYAGFVRMTTLSKTKVPQYIMDNLEPIKDNDEEVKKYGVRLCVEMSKRLLEFGVEGLHFYTLNLERSVRKVLKGLELVTPDQLSPYLPWAQSAAGNRLKEEVRPIFWQNRPRSYIARTGSWDEFPNGRWGDYRSPAFGDLSDYHLGGVAVSTSDVVSTATTNIYGDSHSTEQDIYNVFASYCEGKIKKLPWNDTPLSLESENIKDQLVFLNKNGFLTINSQPAINGVPSTDKQHGWGGKNGFIYKKAYIEFFTSPENAQKLIEYIKKCPMITYHAVNRKGDQKTNTKGTNAVTWGIFPGKEIIQPTVVDHNSFMVWKDEAFALWETQWANNYEKDSKSREILDKMIDSYYLFNIVDNNFISGNIFSPFSDLVNNLSSPTLNGLSLNNN